MIQEVNGSDIVLSTSLLSLVSDIQKWADGGKILVLGTGRTWKNSEEPLILQNIHCGERKKIQEVLVIIS